MMSLVAALLLVAPVPCQEPATSSRPHILLFVADDLGWNGVGYHGGAVRTPVIDALAAGGARLEAFYTQPLCTPARAALMTGRFPMRLGLQHGVIRPWDDLGLSLEERLLPEVLRDAGYETAICGKWHLGHGRPEYLPTRRGFEHQYGCFTGWVDYVDHDRQGVFDWNRDDQPLNERGHVTDLLAEECARLIRERDRERPLFLYVPFTAPHGPYQVARGRRRGYDGIADEELRDHFRMITHMDAAIGRVLGVLDEEGMRDETLVLFVSDNGAPDLGGASNRPLRGHKGNVYEGGVRVPAVVSWPGRIEAGLVVDAPVHLVDLLPTLASVAGGSLEGTQPLDGKDLVPLLTRGAPGPHEELLINTNHSAAALRAGRWKLVVLKRGQKPPRRQLFDVVADPSEERDLAAEYPDEVARLAERLAVYESAAGPELARETNQPPKNYAFPPRWGHRKERGGKGRR